jgi:hypothetical protein
MKKVSSILFALLSVGAVSAGAQMKEMPAGLWEITTKMDIPGLPPEMAAKMGNRVMTQCIKPGERKWADTRAPGPGGGQRQCDPVEPKFDGNKITWEVKCADGTNGTGTVTHNGKDSYSMVMEMNSQRGSMKVNMEGKKIADTCEKAGPPGK